MIKSKLYTHIHFSSLILQKPIYVSTIQIYEKETKITNKNQTNTTFLLSKSQKTIKNGCIL